jgi:hypothetical protein
MSCKATGLIPDAVSAFAMAGESGVELRIAAMPELASGA